MTDDEQRAHAFEKLSAPLCTHCGTSEAVTEVDVRSRLLDTPGARLMNRRGCKKVILPGVRLCYGCNIRALEGTLLLSIRHGVVSIVAVA